MGGRISCVGMQDRTEKGAVIVEACLALPLFLLFMILIAESAIIGYRALATQYVASRAVRLAILGHIPDDSIDMETEDLEGSELITDPEERLMAVMDYLESTGQTVGLAINSSTQVQICPVKSVKADTENLVFSCPENDLGGPGQFIAIEVQQPARMFLGQFNWNMRGLAIGRNEFFTS